MRKANKAARTAFTSRRYRELMQNNRFECYKHLDPQPQSDVAICPHHHAFYEIIFVVQGDLSGVILIDIGDHSLLCGAVRVRAGEIRVRGRLRGEQAARDKAPHKDVHDSQDLQLIACTPFLFEVCDLLQQ